MHCFGSLSLAYLSQFCCLVLKRTVFDWNKNCADARTLYKWVSAAASWASPMGWPRSTSVLFLWL